ncbi:MAG: hypothetical protein ABSC54_00845 [Smithellaceae bacterium]|jgi:hypothetical protein
MLDISVKTDIKGLQQLSKDFPEASQQARFGRITEALLFLEGAVKQATPVGAGPIHLRDTIFSKVDNGEPVEGILGTPAVYGLPVEMGARPHFPPVEPIQFWVEQKLGYSGKEAASVAFLIARAISKRGTKGYGMFSKTFEQNEAKVISILNSIPADIIARITK